MSACIVLIDDCCCSRELSQPLMDNLESHTYEVFEKDPVKYSEYQKAIFYALRDRVPDSEARTRTTYVACLLTFDLLHNFRFTD